MPLFVRVICYRRVWIEQSIQSWWSKKRDAVVPSCQLEETSAALLILQMAHTLTFQTSQPLAKINNSKDKAKDIEKLHLVSKPEIPNKTNFSQASTEIFFQLHWNFLHCRMCIQFEFFYPNFVFILRIDLWGVHTHFYGDKKKLKTAQFDPI